MRDVDIPKNALFLGEVDYLNLAQNIRQHDSVLVDRCSDNEEYDKILKKHRSKIIPLFLLRGDEHPKPILKELPDWQKGDKIAYLPVNAGGANNLTEPLV